MARRLLAGRFEVLEAADGPTALRMMARSGADLVLLDLVLGPPMNGARVLDALRADGRTRGTPVVAVSGLAGAAERTDLLTRGASAVLSKIDHGAVLAALENALARPAEDAAAGDILHAEDDDDWAGLVRRWLEEKGLPVRRMRTGAELLAHLGARSAAPRCVLLDLTLPDADGLELCERVKRDPALQSVPVVIFTGRDIPAAECLRRQALYRVTKGPGARAELEAALDAVLVQQERSRGVVEAGDLRLDPEGGRVFLSRVCVGRLHPGPFAALRLLVRESPAAVGESRLYEAFLSRRPYHKSEPELAARAVVRNYVSRLRRDLGPRLGERLVRVKGRGYAYRPFA